MVQIFVDLIFDLQSVIENNRLYGSVSECVLGSQDWCRNLLSDCVSARASSSPLVELLFLLRESLFLSADGILNVLPTKQYDWSKQNKVTYTYYILLTH